VYIGWNLILSAFDWVLVGFEDPFSWSRIKWINTNTIISMGVKKCNEKNRFRVGCEIEGPPQIQVVRSFPIRGIAVSTPVITVAPQNDIWPHGST